MVLCDGEERLEELREGLGSFHPKSRIWNPWRREWGEGLGAASVGSGLDQSKNPNKNPIKDPVKNPTKFPSKIPLKIPLKVPFKIPSKIPSKNHI